MTQTDVLPVSDAPEGIEPPAPHGRAARRYGLLLVLAVGVLVVSSALGSVAHSHDGVSLETTVIGRCRAVNIANLTRHTDDDFTRIEIGKGKAQRHPDGSWTVVEVGNLSGHVKDGVPDGDRVTVTKTCDFAKASAQRRMAPADHLRVNLAGTLGTVDQEFALDPQGSYTFVRGSGLQGL